MSLNHHQVKILQRLLFDFNDHKTLTVMMCKCKDNNSVLIWEKLKMLSSVSVQLFDLNCVKVGTNL